MSFSKHNMQRHNMQHRGITTEVPPWNGQKSITGGGGGGGGGGLEHVLLDPIPRP